jgi:hypothetical protein
MNIILLFIAFFLLGGNTVSLLLYTLKRPNPLFENDVPEYKKILSEEHDEDDVDKISKTNKIIRMSLSGVSGAIYAIGLFLLFKSFSGNNY